MSDLKRNNPKRIYYHTFVFFVFIIVAKLKKKSLNMRFIYQNVESVNLVRRGKVE